MSSLLFGLALLACPVGMGLMMWMMGRGQGKGTDNGGPQQRQQVEQLRAEIDQLKSERAARRSEGTR
ncbi:MAG: hypothetical protein ACRDRR_09555 [Pseudonocardiaceae bacterium]